MPKVKTEVRTYLVEYVCDACRKGVMRPTGASLMSNPPQFPHICNECGNRQTFLERYPTTVVEPK